MYSRPHPGCSSAPGHRFVLDGPRTPYFAPRVFCDVKDDSPPTPWVFHAKQITGGAAQPGDASGQNQHLTPRSLSWTSTQSRSTRSRINAKGCDGVRLSRQVAGMCGFTSLQHVDSLDVDDISEGMVRAPRTAPAALLGPECCGRPSCGKRAGKTKRNAWAIQSLTAWSTQALLRKARHAEGRAGTSKFEREHASSKQSLLRDAAVRRRPLRPLRARAAVGTAASSVRGAVRRGVHTCA